MADLVIETSALRKVYGTKVAVDDLTLQVPRGEVFGFLGPNGAGKSTSIKMLLGLVAPSSGTARLLGQAPGDPGAMAQVGFLPEHFRFHEWMHAAELLDLHARLYGMDAAHRKRRIPELLELVGLSEQAHRQLSGFSKGMLQRIGLAQALINAPALVFLDEPTSALDPFGRMLVRGIIHDLKAQGTTVFLNSHLLGEVEATCDRVAFIRAGRVLRTIALRDLAAGKIHVELRVGERTSALDLALRDWQLENDAPALFANPTARVAPPAETIASNGAAVATAATAVPTTLHLIVDDEAALPIIAERVVASGTQLYALTPRRISLEQLFLDVIGTEDSGQ